MTGAKHSMGSILLQLKKAQQQAKELNEGVVIYLEPSEIPIEVAENGMKGGYAYRFDTGHDGAIWAIADSNLPDRWNVRVSAKSLMLALYGYDGTKDKILTFLTEELEAISPIENEMPLERISRFDFCVDFVAGKDFVPDPKHFMTHNRSKKKYQGKIPFPSELDLDLVCIDRGNELESITIGKMPNRQIIIYNKSSEVVVHKKTYWWIIWGISINEHCNIWRVEARAGKKELNKYQLKRFTDFEEKAGDVIINILKDFRYVIPSDNDKNRSRWPLAPFWKICIKAADEYLAEYICNAKRADVISCIEKVIRQRYKDSIKGMITSYSAILGNDAAQIPQVLDRVNSEILESIEVNPAKFLKKHKNAEKKFKFIISEQ